MVKSKQESAKTISINSLFSDHLYFLIPFLLFLIAAAIALFSYPTGHWILYFSEHRTPFWNSFFTIGTQLGEEPTYLLAILILLFVKFRYAILVPLTGIVVTIVSFATKALFAHPRPSVYFKELGTFDQINTLEGVRLLTGPTSFPSGHTMSGFAIFFLFALMLPKKAYYQVPLFIMAIIVGLSRIYLVQHFLKDVFAGSICGVLIAALLYYLFSRSKLPAHHWLERSILNLSGKKQPFTP